MKGFMMKKLFVLLALACCLSVGCKPKETTTTEPAPTTTDGATDNATDGAMDDTTDDTTDSADAGS
jgi:hypothetical protein